MIVADEGARRRAGAPAWASRRTTTLALVGAIVAACSGSGGAGSEDASAGATTVGSTSTGTDGASSTSAGATSGATSSATSLATTSTISGVETATAGDTCSFVVCGDQGAVIDDCDLWAQDCPEGEKCAAWADDGGLSWNSTKCVPVAPDPDGVGEPCTVEGNAVSGVDSCEKGAMGWNINSQTNTWECIALCAGDYDVCGTRPNDCCPEGSVCAIGRLLNFCVDVCHPLTDPCGEGDTCIPGSTVGESFICVYDASGGLGAAGDPCEFANGCDPGLLCIDSAAFPGGCGGGAGCCSPWCDIDDPNVVCPADEKCTPWFEEGTAPAGYETLGICAGPFP